MIAEEAVDVQTERLAQQASSGLQDFQRLTAQAQVRSDVIILQQNEVEKSRRAILDFKDGTNTTVTVSDDAAGQRSLITINGLGSSSTPQFARLGLGAPADATIELLISGASPQMKMADTTASAKSLTVKVDANVADLKESAGASGSLLALDLANNRVGVGTAAPNTPVAISGNSSNLQGSLPAGTIMQIGNANGTNTRLMIDAYGAAAGVIDYRRANTSASAPSALAANDNMGQFSWEGYGATGYATVGRAILRASAGEAWDDSKQGTYMTFHTTLNGTTTTSEQLRLTDAGNFKVGGTASRGTTEGTKQVALFNGTAPVGTLTNGVSLYSSAGELYAMNAGGVPWQLSPSAPVTKTADFTWAATENWIINNKSGSSCTATLPTASSFTGRILRIQNYQAQTVVSASSNVVPLGGGAAGTPILAATAGKWATMVSDGTNWIISEGN